MKRRLAVALLGLALLGAAAIVTLRPAGLPPGLVPAAGEYDVRILRDTWGVPHVFGRTDADVGYGLAWAHSEDDFETIQGSLLAARGRLAAAFGREAAANDYMVQLLRIADVVAAGYPRLDPETRALCEAYAAGVNHYAARHPQAAASRFYPVRGEDVVAGFVHKLPLFFGIDKALAELFGDDRPHGASGVEGSNAFAVGPSRAADGGTMLVINSHQPWEGPVAWYEAHLHSDEGWDMVGGVFPGAPVILHGHNRRLGWAHTVNQPDLLDVYVLEADPEDPDRYRFDGGWRRLESRPAPIEVKLLGPLRWTFEREALWSVHGPAVRRPHGTYALRFAGFGDVGQVEQWYRMNKARNLDEWRAAMSSLALPMFNTVYADGEGNVTYVYNGRLPRRAPGYDWAGYLPGDTSETLWSEILPFAELPQVENPPSGFVQSTNSSPFAATAGPSSLDPAGYPPSLGIETRMTNRALRALELLGGDESISRDELDTYKWDVAYSPRSEMARLVARTLALPEPEDPAIREAREVLAAWDLTTEVDNRRAALGVLAFQRFLSITEEVEPPADVELLPALAAAADVLRRHHGRLEVPWGEVNRLRRGAVDLPLAGGPDVLNAVYGELDGHGRLIGRAGDSYVLMVGWDAAGGVSSRSIHQYGSATRDEGSPHFADQAALFARRQLKPVWVEERDIRAHLEREYRPGGEGAH